MHNPRFLINGFARILHFAPKIVFDAKSEVHSKGPHEDTALALLVAQSPGSNAETFHWYEVGTVASHPVPEPPVYESRYNSATIARVLSI